MYMQGVNTYKAYKVAIAVPSAPMIMAFVEQANDAPFLVATMRVTTSLLLPRKCAVTIPVAASPLTELKR